MEDKPNLGGRPPIYPNTQESYDTVAKLCNEYFESLSAKPTDFDPPLVTGLTLFLGFESKNTLYDYAKKDGFSDSIKKALTKIEMFHEMRTASGDKCTGNIFVLKNFNWKDTQNIDHSGNVSNLPPEIKFIDSDYED